MDVTGVREKITLRKCLFRPCDPSVLALFRICFGIFMMMDTIQERGMSRADSRFNVDDSRFCTFPLVEGLKPFRFEIMVVLYATLFWNSFCVAIGYLYRLNIISYTIIYWYIFTLDTDAWNNHSYLFGLIALLFCFMKPHHYMSIDNIIFESNTADVPHWNYMLLRFQVFIVYFYAGLKKTEADWLTGYSMHNLSRGWVFNPLRPFLSNESINLWIVHIGGFVFDSTVGFMLLFGRTRTIGLVLCFCFHGMNAMMFSIGVFPYVMMASSFIFCDPRSFKVILRKISCYKSDCIAKPKKRVTNVSAVKKCSPQSKKWKCSKILVACFCFLYVSLQLFLPYSHFVTKGYNGWTQGLYGYSWDMMVHSFSNQHVKVMYRDLNSGDVGYLKPEAFLRSKRYRWTTQPRMAYQYAVCIREQLSFLGINNSAVYFDVWKSMNKRFQQRIYDPDIDIAGYRWSRFAKPDFVLPLMTNLSNWRGELKKVKDRWKNSTTRYHVVFVADFPGLHLDNYVSEDLGNAFIHVLQGQVVVHIEQMQTNLSAGENIEVHSGKFHRIETVSSIPSCYYYIYINQTAKTLEKRVDEYENWLKSRQENADVDMDDDDNAPEFSKEVVDLYYKSRSVKRLSSPPTRDQLSKFVGRKLAMVKKSYFLFWFSVRNLVFGVPSQQNLAKEATLLRSWDDNRKLRELESSMKRQNKVEL